MRHLKKFNQLNESLAGDEIKKLMSLPYEKFVKELKDAVSNPRVLSVMAAGKLDGLKHDEVVSADEIAVTISSLTPTQSELSLDDSLEKMPEFARDIAANKVLSMDNPIIIANGKYIIDGHHRWTTAYMIAPNAKIQAYNLNIPGLGPIDILKAVQMAIAVEFGEVKTKDPGPGKDAFDVDEKTAIGWIEKNVPQSVLKVTGLRDMAENLVEITGKKLAGSPNRRFMPQPKASAKKAGMDKNLAVSKLLARLQSGTVNFKNPVEDDDI
jgi:hypothetical protein